MKYRSEIDGLRAVAVIPVVLFHSGMPFLEGGYLGVDVFFVISGYLITTIILDDIEKQRFSILSFYDRRFRRILPAYVVVILVSAFFAWLWMMPDELRNFGQSVFATSVFSSNFLFWTEAGYFIAGSAEKPLLHTWSLSVEEQFYVLFPLILLALCRLREGWTVLAIVLLTALSLGLSEYGWRHVPSANFYLLPFRAWELGFGAMSAIYLRTYGPQSSARLSGVGFLTLFLSFALFDEFTPVPSIYALLPVVGTVMIVVFASQTNWVGRLLSQRYLVFVGLISYSTYLWHQPLLAFSRIRSIPSAPDSLLYLAAAASFVFGYLSWRYVEQPFRKRGDFSHVPRASIIGGSIVSLVGLAAIGLAAHFAEGFPKRIPDRVANLANFIYDKSPLENEDNCAFYHGRPLQEHPIEGCDDFLSDRRADVLFIGDSHSGSISYDAQIALADRGISSYAVTYSGCLGLRGFEYLNMPVDYDCLGYNDSMIDYARDTGAKVLVITSRFPLYLYGERFDNGEGGVEEGGEVHYDRVGGDAGSFNLHDSARLQRMLNGLAEELNRLTDEFSVVLLDPIPEAGWYAPKVAARMAFFNDYKKFTVSTDFAKYEHRTAEIISAFDKVDSPQLYRVRPQDIFCNRAMLGRCVIADQDQAYYFDNNHLTRTSARLLVPTIIEGVQSGLRQRQ